MADEKIQEQELVEDGVELNEEELVEIAGGYIHDNRNYGGERYEVIDGKGDVVARFADKQEAMRYARKNLPNNQHGGYSWQRINDKRLKWVRETFGNKRR
ncbi:MAG: hypothetical protein IKG18_08885 [Atopobiaceae bacterium]|nr:hypothetical protein [Atopobiaceae bacterium]MBR3314239.1 hypothetical protein [Atopobiaceae bacterium]